jgi:hypothetical protein
MDAEQKYLLAFSLWRKISVRCNFVTCATLPSPPPLCGGGGGMDMKKWDENRGKISTKVGIKRKDNKKFKLKR